MRKTGVLARTVIPAKAGINEACRKSRWLAWISAFAGMTKGWESFVHFCGKSAP